MMTLIIGGSGSGKSAYAENYLTALAQKEQKYYLATMRIYDNNKEGQAKVERHRSLRAGKGFLTIEQPDGIQEALQKLTTDRIKSAALLECMSNLTANEMFDGERKEASESVADRIVQGVIQLREGLHHLVIVSNNIFEDGVVYEESTMEYIRALGNINERLAAMADEVIEVVAGIPVFVKRRGNI